MFKQAICSNKLSWIPENLLQVRDKVQFQKIIKRLNRPAVRLIFSIYTRQFGRWRFQE